MQFGKRERNHKEGAPLGMDAPSPAQPPVSSDSIAPVHRAGPVTMRMRSDQELQA